MAGLYIHVPFCKQRCSYCDFFSVVNSGWIEPFWTSLQKELDQQYHFLDNEVLDTIYFGGGTPSLMAPRKLASFLALTKRYFAWREPVEITLEANPDDLSKEYLESIQKAGINRLSIGIQSFFDEDLKMMRRRHNAKEGKQAVERAHKTGFDNISADLIYGLPESNNEKWKENLNRLFDLPIVHLSAYHLGIEPNTLLYRRQKEGRLQLPTEHESYRQYQLLLKETENAGFEQYEISNFAKNEKYARHNTSYWQDVPFLGLGPSAHSYFAPYRRWNVANMNRYFEKIDKGEKAFEEEGLSTEDAYNDYLITRLRTKWGISLKEIKERFGTDYYEAILDKIEQVPKAHIESNDKNCYRLTTKGLFLSDGIIEKFMCIS